MGEIQEEISRKRFDLRCAQIQLAGIRAQKELFAASTNVGGTVEGVPDGGPRDRKLSTSSTGNMKSKWVNAFKNIKGLKCKLCRMNVHPDCQEKVVKCQPKSKLLTTEVCIRV